MNIFFRGRVRAIDERWEEVNIRATNTLENIEEDELDRRDPGRKRWGSDVGSSKRRGESVCRRANSRRVFKLLFGAYVIQSQAASCCVLRDTGMFSTASRLPLTLKGGL